MEHFFDDETTFKSNKLSIVFFFLLFFFFTFSYTRNINYVSQICVLNKIKLKKYLKNIKLFLFEFCVFSVECVSLNFDSQLLVLHRKQRMELYLHEVSFIAEESDCIQAVEQ